MHRWASELARLHERRDKEIVEIQRYELVQGIVHQEPGTNKFQVRCHESGLCSETPQVKIRLIHIIVQHSSFTAH